MKIILCGFGLAAPGVLFHLLPNAEKIAIFTHPDLPHAPGLTDTAESLKLWYTTESINRAELPFKPDMIISIYYRYIIKRHIIETCGGRIFNAHPSLLPRHRGCSSVPWAMIDNDTQTGVTFHYIDEGTDTGPIILQAATQIEQDDSQASLQLRLARLVVDYFPAALALVLAGFGGVIQSGQPSYHPRQCPHGGEIDPNWPQAKIERFIRAMNYPPLPPARLYGYDIYTMEDYQMAMVEHYRRSENHKQAVR